MARNSSPTKHATKTSTDTSGTEAFTFHDLFCTISTAYDAATKHFSTGYDAVSKGATPNEWREMLVAADKGLA